MVQLTGLDKVINSWEHEHVHRRCAPGITLREAQAVLAHVFVLADIPERAPVVTLRTPDEAGYVHGAMAYVNSTCTEMVLQDQRCNTTIVLHEAAHVLTEDPIARLECRQPVEKEVHGPVWLSNYLWLLNKLMGPNFNTFYLRSTMPAALNPMQLSFYPTIRGQPRSDLA